MNLPTSTVEDIADDDVSQHVMRLANPTMQHTLGGTDEASH